MIDTLNFKRRSYLLDIKSNTAVVNLPLTVPAYHAVYSDYDTEEKGLQALSYVANIAHYGSPGNIIGLRDEELKRDIMNNLGLPSSFVETNKIKLALLEYQKHYDRGIFGLFKELNRSFDTTRDSISILNSSLDAMVKDIKKQQALKTDSPDVLVGKIKTIMEVVTSVRSLTNTLSKEVHQLREIESILLSEEESSAQLYGGGNIPLSSKTID